MLSIESSINVNRQMKIWGTSSRKQKELSKMLDEWYLFSFCWLYSLFPFIWVILLFYFMIDFDQIMFNV